jgi:hypothetical protein
VRYSASAFQTLAFSMGRPVLAFRIVMRASMAARTSISSVVSSPSAATRIVVVPSPMAVTVPEASTVATRASSALKLAPP